MPEARISTKKKDGLQYNFEFLSKYYVPRGAYEALEERVRKIESKFVWSEEKEEQLIFPSKILETLPPEVKKTVDGIIFNYQHDFPDFCFWGMRKALIDAIRIRFKRDKKEKRLYDESGNAYKLPTWIELAKQERYINPNSAKKLNEKVKIFGDIASHDYMVDLHKEEVPSVFVCLRFALSRMYYEEEKRIMQNQKS